MKKLAIVIAVMSLGGCAMPSSTTTPATSASQAAAATNAQNVKNWALQCTTMDGLLQASIPMIQAGKFSQVQLKVIQSANLAYGGYCASLPADPAAAANKIGQAIGSLTALGISEATKK